MAWDITDAYADALVAGVRTVRFRARLYDRSFQPVGASEFAIADGDVSVDIHAEPMARASFTLLDEDRVLPDSSDPIWLARNFEIYVEMQVAGTWERKYLFFGPVQDVSGEGVQYHFDCDSKDVQHLEPHVITEPIGLRKNTKLHVALRQLFEARGETRFALHRVARRLDRSKPLPVGVEPWRSAKSLASDADLQLYYRGDGTLKTRPWPKGAEWVFSDGPKSTLVSDPVERTSVGPVRDTVIVVGERTEKANVTKTAEMESASVVGATSVTVAPNPAFVALLEPGLTVEIGGKGGTPETKRIAGSYTPGSRTIPLSAALNNKHSKGAPVKVSARVDKQVPIYASASLPDWHRLSAKSLTGGSRPRAEIVERPGVNRKSRAKELANSIRDRIAGLFEQAVEIATVPIWHLEIGDIIAARTKGIQRMTRIQRINYPLSLSGVMDINWSGSRRPNSKRKR